MKVHSALARRPIDLVTARAADIAKANERAAMAEAATASANASRDAALAELRQTVNSGTTLMGQLEAAREECAQLRNQDRASAADLAAAKAEVKMLNDVNQYLRRAVNELTNKPPTAFRFEFNRDGNGVAMSATATPIEG